MLNEGISFNLVNINSETEMFRLACMKDGVVFEIVEGSFRSCLNRQLELLRKQGYTKEQWRIRRD